jgi:hypothetical protein
MKWKYVSYSVSTGIAVTALSFLLYGQGGALFLWPGMLVELMINGVMLFIIHSEDWYSLPSGAYLIFNTAFYSFIVFIILLLLTRLRLLHGRSNA